MEKSGNIVALRRIHEADSQYETQKSGSGNAEKIVVGGVPLVVQRK